MPDRGLVIVLAGPDGAGKTALLERLRSEVLTGDVRVIHHRPGVVPARTRHEGPVTEPHAWAPYGRAASMAKLALVHADWWLGWWSRVVPHVRGGGTVVIERGWWDIAVDARRYRLDVPVAAVRALGRLLPRPDVTLVLHAPADVLVARKAELSPEEVTRQITAWRSLPGDVLRARPVDVAAPLDEVVLSAARALASLPAAHVALPSRHRRRWVLPSRPGRAAAAAVAIHQPMRPVALAAWATVRRLARVGGLRAARSRVAVPPAVEDVLAPHLPLGSILVVAHGSHVGRYAVLVVGRDGRPRVFAKVACDERGRAALAVEAAAHRDLAPALPPGVCAPTLLGAERGLLLFEAVPWRPRRRPWHLPVDLAAAMGRFAAADRARSGWLAHGDFAPWNILATPRGWCVVDWHDAIRGAAPFTDLAHHLVQSHALLGRPTFDALVAGVREGRGDVGAAVDAYARAAGVDARDAAEHVRAYLLRTTPLLDPAERRAPAAISARMRLAEALV